MRIPRYSKMNLSNTLFTIFWWVVHKMCPGLSKVLISFGIRDGAFADKRVINPMLGVKVMGYDFKNPIGVAAGLDKKGTVVDGLIALGFSFGEFGSYTLEKEMPEKKVSYLSQDKGILVQSLGYRNPGINIIVSHLISRRHLPNFIGVNIATSTPTEAENIKQGQHMSYEYEFSLMASKVAPYCDYITLNFSHPEVELSRLVADRATLLPVIQNVREAVKRAAPLHQPKIVVKLPLDLTHDEIILVCNVLQEAAVDGVIVAGLQSLQKGSNKYLKGKKNQSGLLGGRPIKDISTELVASIYRNTQGRIPIIASGGVFTGQDAFEKIEAGASLIQLYSAIIYQGPNVVNKINRELIKILREKGFNSVSEAIGSRFKVD